MSTILSSVDVVGGGAQYVGKRASRVIQDFYAELRQKHAQDRERLQRSGLSGHRAAAMWNRQNVYLDDVKLAHHQTASCRHLARHPATWRGCCKLSVDALRGLIAVQHSISLDLADISLPPAQRRNPDIVGGTEVTLFGQMLPNVQRCSYIIDGQKFDFPQKLAEQASTVDGDLVKVEKLQRSFTTNLVDAVQGALARSGEPPLALLHAVGAMMSNVGLASAERSCESPQIAVSGGESLVQYELQSHSGGSVDITMLIVRVRFQRCIIYPGPSEPGAAEMPGEDPSPVTCGSGSRISTSCTVRLSVLRDARGEGVGVDADVLRLKRVASLLDAHGKPLPGFGSRRFLPDWLCCTICGVVGA